MAQRKTLTVAQLEVLRWIGEGCPEGVYESSDPAHRVSAAALARRGLVEVTGKRSNWQAAITATGREYLERAAGPDPFKPRQANVSVTQQLVDDVIAAGGSLRLPQRSYHDRDGVDYRRRAELAERYGKVPADKRLVVENISPQEIELKLVDASGLGVHAVTAVPVPERVGRYHPLVRRFRDGKDRHEVSRAALPRATRILQGLVVEAERRGHAVEAAAASKPERYGRSGWSGSRDGHLVITAQGCSESLRISEEGLPSRSHWDYTNRSYDSWAQKWKTPPIGEYEAGATGRLQIEIVGYGGGQRQSKWADRQSWSLEEKLGEILREIELRAIEAEERRQEAEKREADRQRDWEAAMDRAKLRWLEDNRAEVLKAEAAAWRQAESIRAYCKAAEEKYPDDPGALEWLEWARTLAAAIDPLSGAPAMPAIPESVPLDELSPYLGGRSPYGPDRGYR